TSVSLPTAGTIGMILFEASAGQRAAVKVTSSSITSTNISLLNPDGSVAGWNTICANGFVETPLLTKSGTHTIVIDPNVSYTGNITFTLYVSNDLTGTITPGGSSITTNITTPGQNARYIFAGSANQRISLKVTGVSLSGGGNLCSVSVNKPDGTPV